MGGLGGLMLFLAAAAAVVIGASRWPPGLPRRRAILAVAVRILVVALISAAVSGARLYRRSGAQALMAVVDLSDSTRMARASEAEAVRQLVRAKSRGDLFGVVVFGTDAQAEQIPARSVAFEDFEARPDGAATDIASALHLAANLIPDGFSRHLVLIGDGRQTAGDAVAAAALLRREGVRVDTTWTGVAPGPEALVASLQVPSTARPGRTLAALARLRASQPSAGTLAVSVDGHLQEARKVDVPAGDSSQGFSLPAMPAGVHTVRVELDAKPDTFVQNNVAEASVRVLGAPSVLILEGSPGAGANVAGALRGAGMGIEIKEVDQAPTSIGGLAAYDGFVLVDTPAGAFPTGSMEAMKVAVRDLGRGLVAIGGGQSFGPGGWHSTPLEEALPVDIEVPTPRKEPDLAVVIAMETTESAEGDRLAEQAARSAIDSLKPDDELGILALGEGEGSSFVYPLAALPSKEDPKGALRGAILGDPEGYAAGLRTAVDAVSQSARHGRHVLFIGDGDASTALIEPVAASARARGVQISAIGVDADRSADQMARMAEIARLGGGRFYRAEVPGQIPQLVLKEEEVERRGWVQRGDFTPVPASAGDLLGTSPGSSSRLSGYLVTVAKPGAEVALKTALGDPLLAGWTFGLGRAAAWTSDSEGRWSTDLVSSPGFATFFSHLADWALPVNGGSGDGLELEASPSAEGLEISARGPGPVQVEVVAPDLKASSHRLEPAAPGRLGARVPAGQAGTYVVHATDERGGALADAAATFAYPAEYYQLGDDVGALREIARAGGGAEGDPAPAWSRPVPSTRSPLEISWALLALAAAVWPIDVALRRLNLSRPGSRSMARGRKDDGDPEPREEAPFARLSARLAISRSQGGNATEA